MLSHLASPQLSSLACSIATLASTNCIFTHITTITGFALTTTHSLSSARSGSVNVVGFRGPITPARCTVSHLMEARRLRPDRGQHHTSGHGLSHVSRGSFPYHLNGNKVAQPPPWYDDTQLCINLPNSSSLPTATTTDTPHTTNSTNTTQTTTDTTQCYHSFNSFRSLYCTGLCLPHTYIYVLPKPNLLGWRGFDPRAASDRYISYVARITHKQCTNANILQCSNF